MALKKSMRYVVTGLSIKDKLLYLGARHYISHERFDLILYVPSTIF